MNKITESLDGIEAIFLDLDGTIYLGNKLIDGAKDFLVRLKKRKIRIFYLSNNSSKSVSEYVEKLENLGIQVVEEEILLSTHDLISWLSKNNVSDTFVVGTRGMKNMLEESGITTESKEPEFVVLGYDTEVNYEKLAKASIHLHNGVPLVASHPDIVCPSPFGVLPDSGAFMELFRATTGVSASHVSGKPNADMLLHKIEELDIKIENCAMVGDRLYTDIEMASRAGIHGILVLSGEAKIEDIEDSKIIPSLIVDSVKYLLPNTN